MTNFIRAERRKVLSGESGASEGLRRQERERKMFQVQLHNINKQLNVSKDQLTRSLSLLTSMAEHTQTHTSVAQRTRGTSCAWQFKGLLECGLWFMHHSCVNKQCLLLPCPAPPYNIYAVTCNLMQTRMRCTPAFPHQHMKKNKKNTPDYQIIADKCDEDTWKDGGRGGGSRGEEGTYRNKFPVPASRTLSERRRERK